MVSICGREHDDLEHGCPDCLASEKVAPQVSVDRGGEVALVSEEIVRDDCCPYCRRPLPASFPDPPNRGS